MHRRTRPVLLHSWHSVFAELSARTLETHSPDLYDRAKKLAGIKRDVSSR
jgi:hypothetical protein